MRAYLNGVGQPYDIDAYRQIPNNAGRLLETKVGKSRLLMHWEPKLHELMHVASEGWYFDPHNWMFVTDDFCPTALYVYRVPIDNAFDRCYHSSQPAVLQRYEPGKKSLLPKFVPFYRGGAVIAVIFDDDCMIRIGVSVCSTRDIFDFRSGAQMAYDRALGEQDLPKLANRTLREAYLQISHHYHSVSDQVLFDTMFKD